MSSLVILLSLILQKCNAINPQLSSFGSEVELNEVSDTIQQLLRWGWKYNKNLEEQAAQLHMLTGWSQIVEVSVFIFLLYFYFYVCFGILHLHFANGSFAHPLGLCIQKNIISWKSIRNFISVGHLFIVFASFEIVALLIIQYEYWQVAWCLFVCFCFNGLFTEDGDNTDTGSIYFLFSISVLKMLHSIFSKFLVYCLTFFITIITQGCSYMHGQATWWKISMPWKFKCWHCDMSWSNHG